MLNKTLKTARCTLRRIEPADASCVFDALRAPGFTDGLIGEPPASISEAGQLIESYLEAWETRRRFVFAIIDGNARFTGIVNLFRRDQEGLWSVGVWIVRERWGEGLAGEAARTVIDAAFRDLKADVVHAAHVHWNDQSRRVLLKLGMKFVFRREQGILKDGEWVPNLHYEISRAEWDG